MVINEHGKSYQSVGHGAHQKMGKHTKRHGDGRVFLSRSKPAGVRPLSVTAQGPNPKPKWEKKTALNTFANAEKHTWLIWGENGDPLGDGKWGIEEGCNPRRLHVALPAAGVATMPL